MANSKTITTEIRVNTQIKTSLELNKEFKLLKNELTKLRSMNNEARSELNDTIVEGINDYLKKEIEKAKTELANSDCNMLSPIDKMELKTKISSISATLRAKGETLMSVEDFNGTKTLMLTRVSSMLSMNKPAESEAFITLLREHLDTLPDDAHIYVKTTGQKAKIETELFRTDEAWNVFQLMVKALDRGMTLYYTQRGNPRVIDYTELISLFSKGLQISIHERTTVYNGLFSGEEYKAFSSHMPQFLQWHFGLNRSMPKLVYLELFEQFDGQLKFTKENMDVLDDCVKSAKELLKSRQRIFGINNIKVCYRKIDEFISLVKANSEISNPLKKSKKSLCTTDGHELLNLNGVAKCGVCGKNTAPKLKDTNALDKVKSGN